MQTIIFKRITVKNSIIVSLDKHEPFDATGRTAYNNTCKKVNVTPVSYFFKHICDSEIDLQYHGIGPKGARAISAALVVRFIEPVQLSLLIY